jgi:flagellar biosynthesis GTPase FlhF
MFLNLTTGEYLKPLVYSLVGWLPMISSIFGLKCVKNKKLTITFFINGIFNILVMIFAVFKIREGFQNVEYITAIQLGIITLAYYFIASQKKQNSDSVHFYINLNISTILLWGFVVFSIFFAPNESFIEELIFNGIGFGIISVIILIVSGITYSCNLTKFKIKKAKEAKEKAEREAREKKEKAEQKAREKKEKAEREAREAKEKAEREAQEAKEKEELLSRIKNIDGDVNKAKKAIAEKISEEKNAIEKIKQEIKQIEEQIAKTPNTGMGLVNKAKFAQQKTELEKSIDYTKIQVLEEKNKQLLDLFSSIKELDNKTKNEKLKSELKKLEDLMKECKKL